MLPLHVALLAFNGLDRDSSLLLVEQLSGGSRDASSSMMLTGSAASSTGPWCRFSDERFGVASLGGGEHLGHRLAHILRCAAKALFSQEDHWSAETRNGNGKQLKLDTSVSKVATGSGANKQSYSWQALALAQPQGSLLVQEGAGKHPGNPPPIPPVV